MSVYRPRKSPYWAYDFQIKGRRFHGSTGVETKRAAEQVERDIRNKAALGLLDDAAQMTLDRAAGRYWTEHGSTLKDAERLFGRIERMVMAIGPGLKLGEITTDVVAQGIQVRRGQTFTKTDAPGAREYLPKPATVNRDMIDALRPILNRARKVWGAKLPEINWVALRMKEPKPKPREFAAGDQQLVYDEVMPHWHDLIDFGARYGCRLSELFFKLSDLDVDDVNDARVKLRERKGGDDHVIPLLPEDAAMFAARKGRAEAANRTQPGGKIDTVWFREIPSKIPGRPARLRALTYHGAAIALRRAMTRSGLREAKGMKGAHDMRHNSGMKILRATGDIRLAQKLLGHADIKSTLVYAHAVEADVKRGLAGLPRNSPGAPSGAPEKAVSVEDHKATGTEGS